MFTGCTHSLFLKNHAPIPPTAHAMGFLGADSVEFNAFCQLFCFLFAHFCVSCIPPCSLHHRWSLLQEAYKLKCLYAVFLLLLIQDTALLIEAAYPFWTCVRGPVEPDDRPRTPCPLCALSPLSRKAGQHAVSLHE